MSDLPYLGVREENYLTELLFFFLRVVTDDKMGVSRTDDSSSVERPWGWLVTAAAFLVNIMSLGFSWSTGVLNAIFMDTFDEPALDISWVGTLLFANMLSSGECCHFGSRFLAFP